MRRDGSFWDGPTDNWFWIHLAQVILFTVLAVWAFLQLARAGLAPTNGIVL